MSDLGKPWWGYGCTFRPTTARTVVAILVCTLVVPALATEKDAPPGEIQLTRRALLPVVRQQASPSGGQPVAVNPPPLLWPRTNVEGVRYDVRLSPDATFPKEKTLGATGQSWAVFNPHKKLALGTWYWQYAPVIDGTPTWSPVHVFQVTDAAPVFETRTAQELLAACPRTPHPRLLVRAENLPAFRQRVKSLETADRLVSQARKYLGQNPPDEKDAAPKRKGKTQRQSQKLASDASKGLGQRVWTVVAALCRAYLITCEEPFGREAIRWAVHVAQWDRAGISGRNNLGDMFCLETMVLTYDSCHGLLTEADKRRLLKGIQARAGHFFSTWRNRVETTLHREHVWGHIFQPAIEAALVTVGDLPDADEWLTYAYEVWLARAPTAGGLDGGWMVGTNYNGIEGKSLIAIPSLFQSVTKDNLFAAPFYRNNLYYLIYCQPPRSYGDGFGDAHEMAKGPRSFHLRYIEALGRRTGDPYAAWYLRMSRPASPEGELDKNDIDWSGLSSDRATKLPEWHGPFALPQARAFRQAGVVAMHTHLEEPTRDLFVGFRSSPWGSFDHAQADQNTFNVIVGGERLFYSSGYKMPMGDPHMMGWYKHTRGHNGILVDGKGQPFGTEAYGWIPRFLHGDRLTYCVGDASRAYDVMPESEAGLKRFRRHVLLLRPATVIVYDDLVADHPAEWSWLLHSMEKMRVEADQHRLFASAKEARGRVDLFGSVPLRFDLSGHFGVPAVNWRGKVNKDGEELEYADNQWHFTARSGRKTPAMRYLAIMQVRQGGETREFTDVTLGPDGWMRAGEWQVRAELDATKKPYLEVRSLDGAAGLVTGRDRLTVGGKPFVAQRAGGTLLVEKAAGQWRTQEAVDEVPDVAR